ncbi:MAG: flagellar hook basal-body protein [Myxococcales bacterium]|nr:flagellar hook basal-body protein [Myxococcales bacterium]
MADGIYSAVSGAVAQARRLDVVANNLANVSTRGFKGGRAAFAEILARSAGASSGSADVRYAELTTTKIDLRPGALRQSGKKSDVSLEGPGLFAVKRGKETLYTRALDLRVDQRGTLMDTRGVALLDERNKVIRVADPNADVRIGEDGSVRVGNKQLARLQIVEALSPQSLSRRGETLFAATPAAKLRLAQSTRARQGYIESSNVNFVRGMTEMIEASRSYEAFHRVISTFKEVDSKMTTIADRR